MMKTIEIRKITILVLAGFLLVGLNLNAQRGYGQRGMPEKQKDHPGLDLSEEQQEQVKALKIDHMKQVQPLKDQLIENKAHQKTLMNADEPDINSVYKNIDKATKLQNEIAKLGADFQLKFKSILTDEQKVMYQSGRNRFAKAGFRQHQRANYMNQRPMHRGMYGNRWDSPRVDPGNRDQK